MSVQDVLGAIFEDDAAGTLPLPSDDALRRVSAVAAEMIALEKEMEELNQQLTAKTQAWQLLRTKTLPELMRELNVVAIKLTDGSMLEVAQVIDGSISEERREAAFEWLRRHKQDGIIKSTVTFRFDRGEDAKAMKLLAWGKSKGLDFEAKQAVHAQTLKAFVREKIQSELEQASEALAAGKQRDTSADLPHDLFGVYIADVAKVTTTKPRPKRVKKG